MAENSRILKQIRPDAPYAEVVRFLSDVQRHLLSSEYLPSEDPLTYVYCPSLKTPQRGAGDIPLAFEQHLTKSEEDQFLYIGDVFNLINEIHHKIIDSAFELQKRDIKSEAAQHAFSELVSKENDLFTHIRLTVTRNEITPPEEAYLLNYRKSYYRELEQRALAYITLSIEIAKELGEDLEPKKETDEDRELDEGEGEPKLKRVVIPLGGAQETDQNDNQTDQGEREEAEPNDRARQHYDIAQEFESLRALTLETERLTNFYLVQFGEFSSIPPELFDDAFKNAVRSSINQAILEKLGLAGVKDLYANPSLRISVINDLHTYLNRNREFIRELNLVIERRYQALQKTNDVEGIREFQEKLVAARDPATFALFRAGLADHPDFQIKTEFHFSTDPKTELIRVCETLSYFDQSRLEFEVDQVVEVVDALVARGVPPSFLNHLSTNRFNLLFGRNLSPEEFNDFKEVLAAYWYLHRHDYQQEQLQIDWKSRGTSADELAAVSTMSDDEFKAHFVAPTHSSIGSARANNTRSEAHVYAVGTAVGDDSKVDQRTDANYVKKLKQEFYQKQYWQDLSEKYKIALLKEKRYQEFEIQKILESGEMPADFTLADLGNLENNLAYYGDDVSDEEIDWDDWDDWDESVSPFEQIDIGSTPHASRNRAQAGKKMGAKQPGQSEDTATAAKKQHAKRKKGQTGVNKAGKTTKNAASAAKKAAKKTKKKAEKEVDKAITGGAALAANAVVPGAGTVINALPPEIREIFGKTIRYIGGALAAIGALLAAATAYLISSLAVPVLAVVGGIVGGVVGFFVGGPVGVAVGAGVGASIGAGGGAVIKSSAAGTGVTHSTAPTSSALHTAARPEATHAAPATATATTTAPAATTTATIFNPATSAVGYTAGSSAVFATITTMLIGSSLLADFPPGSAYTNDPNVKLSYYADLEKTVETGCPDNKCPEITSGTLEVTYIITLKPKGEGTCITITEINDIIKTRYSKKKYEELGKPLPSKPDREKHLEDFPDLLSTDPNDPRNTICSGETLTFSYTETFDKSYNHALITNTFEAKFYWKNSTGEGNDSVMTGASFCIGDCAMESGCWPATGSVSQAPFSPNWSHAKMDAFDIAAGIGTPLYAIFPGELCPGNSDPGYGNHVILTAAEGTFLYGHLSEVHLDGSCKHVEAGETVGLMGNTGNSTGPHLHFEIAHNGGWFRASPPSLLHHPGDPSQGILPPSDDGTKPITPALESKYLHVTSCYDGQ